MEWEPRVSQGRKENARACGEREGRTTGTSSKRNRNRATPQALWSFLTAIDMIPSYENKLGMVRIWTLKKYKYASFVFDQNVKILSILNVQISKLFLNWSQVACHNLFQLFVRITGEKIPPEDKLSASDGYVLQSR